MEHFLGDDLNAQVWYPSFRLKHSPCHSSGCGLDDCGFLLVHSYVQWITWGAQQWQPQAMDAKLQRYGQANLNQEWFINQAGLLYLKTVIYYILAIAGHLLFKPDNLVTSETAKTQVCPQERLPSFMCLRWDCKKGILHLGTQLAKGIRPSHMQFVYVAVLIARR